MGGHGGLNILPQKSWNVYNRDNRQRVERDEAAAEAAARVEERDARRANLAQNVGRMRERSGAGEAPTRAEHINFFAAEERASGNIAAVAENKLKVRHGATAPHDPRPTASSARLCARGVRGHQADVLGVRCRTRS